MLPWLHRIVREFHHAVMNDRSHGSSRTTWSAKAARPAASPSGGARLSGRVRGQNLGFDVPGEGANLLDEGPSPIEAAGTETSLHVRFAVIRSEKVSHLDDRCLILAVGLDVKDRDDGINAAGLDGDLDRVFGVGPHTELGVAKQDLLAAFFKSNHAILHGASGICGASSGSSNLHHPEDVGVERRGWNLEEEIFVDAMSVDEADVGDRLVGDHVVVRLGFIGLLRDGVGSSGSIAAASPATSHLGVGIDRQRAGDHEGKGQKREWPERASGGGRVSHI